MLHKYIKTALLVALGVILTVIFTVLYANHRVVAKTDGLTYNDTASIPYNKVGLLLGTSKLLRSGRPNQYFTHRIEAAVELYKAGKIKAIVISGDNGRQEYNEPEDMKQELVKRGIPETQIYLDYAGFRTLDSVIRMDKIFGQQEFTVISQEFHNRRAIYIASAYGLHAIGYNAEDVSAYNGLKTQLREKLARVKLFLDLWSGKTPKFLGEKIDIP
jgi:SanA protein